MELLNQTAPEERKFVLELTQSEVGTLFACMDKTDRISLRDWNKSVGNHYDQLQEYEGWQSLKDLLHSIAVFSHGGVIKDGKVD